MPVIHLRPFLIGLALALFLWGQVFGAQGQSSDLPRVSALFRDFVKTLKPADFAAGSGVANATRLYERLLDAHIDTRKARLVLLMRELNRGMPQPMYPDQAFVRGEKPDFWFWHAFVAYDGVVFDPHYIRDDDDLRAYFDHLWARDQNRDRFWVFAVQYQDLPRVAGTDYPGGPPRMLGFSPITVPQFIASPLHLTVPR